MAGMIQVSEAQALPDDPLMKVTLAFVKYDWLQVKEAYLTDGTPLFTEEQKAQIDQLLLANTP